MREGWSLTMSLSRAGIAGFVIALLVSAVTGCSAAAHDAAAPKAPAAAADVKAPTSAQHAQHRRVPAGAPVDAGASGTVAAVEPASHQGEANVSRNGSHATDVDHAGL